MKHWHVTSPEYSYVEPVLDDGSGPIETTISYAEVIAPTKRIAKILAVKVWGSQKSIEEVPDWYGDLDYCYRETNPYAKLKVKEIFPCPIHEWDIEGCAELVTFDEEGNGRSPCENRSILDRAIKVLGEDYFA